MATVFEVPAEIRSDAGKGASRRLRRQGQVPGIVYGGDREPAAVQIEQKFLVHALEREAFYSSILNLRVGDGRTQKVILRDLQRHPFKAHIMHVDFQRVSETEPLRMMIPLHFVNEEGSPAGKKSGVVISHQVTEVEVMCLPKDLPEYLEVDLAEMDVGDIVHLSDIPLPEGVDITALMYEGEDANVVTAQHIQVAPEPTEEEDLEEVSPDVPTVEEDREEGEDDSQGEDDKD